MTTQSRGPEDVIDAYAAAWVAGTPEVAWAFYADDIVMRLPGRGTLAGEHRGRPAVIGAIAALLARTDGTPVTVEVVDRLTSSNRVALVLREVAQRGDRVLDLRRVNLYEVVDGMIVAIDVFEADQYEVDEFFA
jgi:ketosteroid isomerase-like protein